MRVSRFTTVTFVIYTALFAGSIIYFFAFGEDALSGAPILLLTLPWSLIIVLSVNFISPEVLESSISPSMVIMVVSFLINSVILFWVGTEKGGCDTKT